MWPVLSSNAMALDTAVAAELLHEQSYRELGMGGRLKIALELSDLTHAFAVAGIRRRHPEWSEAEARRHLASVLYGPAVTAR